MKLYYVNYSVICGENDHFLVKANNKKEALNKVWEQYFTSLKEYKSYRKKDLSVQDVEKELFQGKLITCLC